MSQPTPSSLPWPEPEDSRISITHVAVDPRAERRDDVARALALIGFAVRRDGGGVVAESDRVEAEAARRYLRALGFRGRDFQVSIERRRAWGVR
jgi:ribosomal protein S18 acetylase RimI-like enzyme